MSQDTQAQIAEEIMLSLSSMSSPATSAYLFQSCPSATEPAEVSRVLNQLVTDDRVIRHTAAEGSKPGYSIKRVQETPPAASNESISAHPHTAQPKKPGPAPTGLTAKVVAVVRAEPGLTAAEVQTRLINQKGSASGVLPQQCKISNAPLFREKHEDGKWRYYPVQAAGPAAAESREQTEASTPPPPTGRPPEKQASPGDDAAVIDRGPRYEPIPNLLFGLWSDGGLTIQPKGIAAPDPLHLSPGAVRGLLKFIDANGDALATLLEARP